MKKIIGIFLVFIFFTATVNAQTCSSVRPYDPNICLFSGSLNGISGSTSSNLCGEVNTNPFSLPPVSGDADTCQAKVYEDGNACVEFYFKMRCSSACIACNQFICKYFCENAASICPKTAAANCFGTLNYCDSDNTDCTNWGVDKSKFPAAPTTTKAATTTTSTTTKAGTSTTSNTGTSTTTSDQTSGAFTLSVFPVFAFLLIFAFFSFLFQ